MTNRQLNFENIHRVENLTYESLEKKYINVQVVGTVLTYIGMMLLVLFILLVEKLSYRTFIVAGMEGLLLCSAIINLILLPKAYAYKGLLSVSMTSPTGPDSFSLLL